MHVSVIVPPPVEPITAQEAFEELRLVVGGDRAKRTHPDYAAVMSKVAAARRECESIAGIAFVQQRLRVVGSLELIRGPVLSIAAIRYFDASNELQTVDEAAYFLIQGAEPSVRFVRSFSVPAAYDRPDAWSIDYLAGFPPGEPADDWDPEDPPQHLAANVPPNIREAIRLSLRMLWQDMTPADREATTNARDALLLPDRVMGV